MASSAGKLLLEGGTVPVADTCHNSSVESPRSGEGVTAGCDAGCDAGQWPVNVEPRL